MRVVIALGGIQREGELGMNELLTDHFGVIEKKGIPVVSSRNVAEVFQKEHRNVLRDIDKLIKGLLKIEQSKWQENYINSSYKNEQGKKQPEFLMTKKGFTLLAVGFTGTKALRFKVQYINRFEEMESFIQSLTAAKMEFPAFTQAIMDAHEEPKHYHFSNEINLINKIVLGMDAKEFKAKHGLDKSISSIRPYLSLEQIGAIETLQRIDIGLQLSIPDYHERKKVLQDYYANKLQQRLLVG